MPELPETPVRGLQIRQEVEGRAVIGDGAPFDAQLGSLGVQGWIQTAALSRLKKRVFKEKHGRGKKVADDEMPRVKTSYLGKIAGDTWRNLKEDSICPACF